jgi:hypothetical protein
MQNFGRGMWRRVGDYERIQKPILLQQSRLEQWQQFVQQQAILKKQQQYMEQKQKQVVSIEKNESELTEENEIKQTVGTIKIQEVQPEYSDLPVVIPKKTKRKNKK